MEGGWRLGHLGLGRGQDSRGVYVRAIRTSALEHEGVQRPRAQGTRVFPVLPSGVHVL